MEKNQKQAEQKAKENNQLQSSKNQVNAEDAEFEEYVNVSIKELSNKGMNSLPVQQMVNRFKPKEGRNYSLINTFRRLGFS
jgi:hypothetical protein